MSHPRRGIYMIITPGQGGGRMNDESDVDLVEYEEVKYDVVKYDISV